MQPPVGRLNLATDVEDAPRTVDVVGTQPKDLLAEQNDEWTEARRYMGRELLAKARLHPIESETNEPTIPTELTA
ncbi:hypothetical protein ACIBQ5_15760 [Streptomyces massasporeus]|uniref:hypothetical protein n=1 Tax=Streptomyces TaxID=1883 RepID=UPI0017DF045D|nr:hypothetical protein [Streptomyces sp. AK010]MBB6417167.1 hypothetical protein [Streptomyces sp. AK010]